MKAFYLKSPTKLDMEAALTVAGLANDGFFGDVYLDRQRYDLEPIGDCYHNGQLVSGYHLNLRGDSLPDALKPFQVFPKTPSRVF